MRRPLTVALGVAGAPLLLVAGLAALTAALVGRARGSYPARGRLVATAYGSLHYLERGAGPAVVFIHGAKGSTLDATYSVFDAVAERYRAIALDRPGSGYSPAGGDLSPREQARLIRAALARLGVERPILVGHSLGAAVVMRYLVDYPGEAAAAVTVGGYTLPFGWQGSPLTRLLLRPRLGRLAAATVVVPLGRLLAPAVVRRAAHPAPTPRAWARAAAAMALTPSVVLADAATLTAAHDDLLAAALHYREIDTPLVLVHGAHDHVIWPSLSEQTHRRVRGSELVVLAGAGHLPQFSQPAAVVAAIDRAAELGARREHGGAAAPPAGPAPAGDPTSAR
jgi:pimeloyl-ACP methyl ester carboxylesterase